MESALKIIVWCGAIYALLHIIPVLLLSAAFLGALIGEIS